jgi:hypothetical protein
MNLRFNMEQIMQNTSKFHAGNYNSREFAIASDLTNVLGWGRQLRAEIATLYESSSIRFGTRNVLLQNYADANAALDKMIEAVNRCDVNQAFDLFKTAERHAEQMKSCIVSTTTR